MHRCRLWQPTASGSSFITPLVEYQAEAPPAGSVELNSSEPVAIQKWVLGQDRVWMSSAEPAGVTIFQAEARPSGSLVVRMLPSSSPATQKWVLGQDRALMPALDARASASATFQVEAA